VNSEALKLTTYFGERDRTPSGLLADELLGVFGALAIEASVLLRGSEGFGQPHQLRSDRLLSLSQDLPLVSVAIDTPERIEAALERILEIKHRGLVTVERTRMLSGEVEAGELPGKLGEAAKLSVYVGRQERVGRVPAHVAVCELLHRRGVAGASVLAGVDGTRRGERVRARFFGANTAVPVVIVAVAPGEVIAGVLAELGAMLRQPLLTLERVRVCKRDGELLARPHELPGTDDAGRPLWQKLTVHCSQAATHSGRPLNLEIIRRLRAADAAGATSVRGIWGFHGDHAPHGDRLLQVRRHVPVVTVAIDTPERTARSFSIIDELTAESGLVTSEMVPALAALAQEGGGGAIRLAKHDF
jgi:PII-like signaling protein